MRKLITISLVSLCTCAKSQNLLKNTHQLTGEKWKETTWEPFIAKGFKTRGYEVFVRLRKQDKKFYLELRNEEQIRSHQIDKGDALGFISRKDSLLLVLTAIDGIDTRDLLDAATYPITIEQMQILLDNHVKDVKMEYRKGYVLDGLTERKLLSLRNAIMLITSGTRFDDRKPKIVERKK